MMMLDTIWEGAQQVCKLKVPKKGGPKVQRNVRVRWLAWYMARRKGHSYADIGRFFEMHHTSVMWGALEFEKLDMMRELRALEEYLENPPVPVQPASEMEMRERLQRIEERIVKATREKLPDDRQGITLHFVIHTAEERPDGTVGAVEVDGYVQTGNYFDGRLAELFIKCGRHGDQHAMLDQWAISASVALQYGAPVEDLMKKFTGSRFEPSGIVTGVEGIKRCTSPLDLVSRWLLLKYGKKEEIQA